MWKEGHGLQQSLDCFERHSVCSGAPIQAVIKVLHHALTVMTTAGLDSFTSSMQATIADCDQVQLQPVALRKMIRAVPRRDTDRRGLSFFPFLTLTSLIRQLPLVS